MDFHIDCHIGSPFRNHVVFRNSVTRVFIRAEYIKFFSSNNTITAAYCQL